MRKFLALALIMTALAASAAEYVMIKTSMGDIEVELFNDKTPVTVKNFLSYVDKGTYNGTIFHRVIKDFMIQGGGFDEKFNQKPTDKPIQNEADNKVDNAKGTLAMARTGDPHSATDQFFINTKDNDFLNHTAKNARGWGYCVFGKVIKGMDVVEKIQNVKTGSRYPHEDVPVKNVVIKEIIRCAAPQQTVNK